MSPSQTPKESGRGGKRPGAGAPSGNLNAYKHGRYSLQAALFIQALLGNPKTRRLLIHLVQGQVPRVPRHPPLPSSPAEFEQAVIDLLRMRYGADRIDPIIARAQLARVQQSKKDGPRPQPQVHPQDQSEK